MCNPESDRRHSPESLTTGDSRLKGEVYQRLVDLATIEFEEAKQRKLYDFHRYKGLARALFIFSNLGLKEEIAKVGEEALRCPGERTRDGWRFSRIALKAFLAAPRLVSVDSWKLLMRFEYQQRGRVVDGVIRGGNRQVIEALLNCTEQLLKIGSDDSHFLRPEDAIKLLTAHGNRDVQERFIKAAEQLEFFSYAEVVGQAFSYSLSKASYLSLAESELNGQIYKSAATYWIKAGALDRARAVAQELMNNEYPRLGLLGAFEILQTIGDTEGLSEIGDRCLAHIESSRFSLDDSVWACSEILEPAYRHAGRADKLVSAANTLDSYPFRSSRAKLLLSAKDLLEASTEEQKG